MDKKEFDGRNINVEVAKPPQNTKRECRFHLSKPRARQAKSSAPPPLQAATSPRRPLKLPLPMVNPFLLLLKELLVVVAADAADVDVAALALAYVL